MFSERFGSPTASFFQYASAASRYVHTTFTYPLSLSSFAVDVASRSVECAMHPRESRLETSLWCGAYSCYGDGRDVDGGLQDTWVRKVRVQTSHSNMSIRWIESMRATVLVLFARDMIHAAENDAEDADPRCRRVF